MLIKIVKIQPHNSLTSGLHCNLNCEKDPLQLDTMWHTCVITLCSGFGTKMHSCFSHKFPNHVRQHPTHPLHVCSAVLEAFMGAGDVTAGSRCNVRRAGGRTCSHPPANLLISSSWLSLCYCNICFMVLVPLTSSGQLWQAWHSWTLCMNNEAFYCCKIDLFDATLMCRLNRFESFLAKWLQHLHHITCFSLWSTARTNRRTDTRTHYSS